LWIHSIIYIGAHKTEVSIGTRNYIQFKNTHTGADDQEKYLKILYKLTEYYIMHKYTNISMPYAHVINNVIKNE